MKCIYPIQIKSPDGFLQQVPCGHCVNCTINRQMAWTLRIYLEASCSEFSSFLTLTYEEDIRPKTLDYEHIDKFLRLLRKSFQRPIRYFCVGEYGKLSGREHWHLILFNSPLRVVGPSRIKQWPHGGVHFGEVTAKSAAYTARYSLKTGLKGGDYVANMSRRPGIGLDRIRQISRYMAQTNPILESPPTWWRLGKRLYPLDKTSRTVMVDSYLGAGGHFKMIGRSRLGLDLQARITTIVGDPGVAESEFRVQTFEREDMLHGSI